MSDPLQRTNTYTAAPVSDRYRQCLFDWLAAHAPLWNQLTYRRRQQYFSEDGDVWAADCTDLYDDYARILGKATCQQVARKNSEAWRSHFRLLEMYHDDSEATVTEKPSPPGYWGTREEGYELHGLVRNDLYTFEWDDDKSTLEFGVGEVLEDRYDFGHNERLTLEVQGNPQWDGADSRLELVYDESADGFVSCIPSAFSQTRFVHSGWMPSLTHSIPRTRPTRRPSTSARTIASRSSPTPARQPFTTRDRSSNDSMPRPSRSQRCRHTCRQTGTPASGFSDCTMNARENVTIVVTQPSNMPASGCSPGTWTRCTSVS